MKKQNNSALFTLITVFFFWGFFGASNGVFIPFCKTYFQLDQFQAQLVEFAFYGAYFIGALILFIWSSFSKKDIFRHKFFAKYFSKYIFSKNIFLKNIFRNQKLVETYFVKHIFRIYFWKHIFRNILFEKCFSKKLF